MTRTRKPTRRRKPAYTPVATVNTIEVPPDSPLTTKEGWAAFVRHTPQPPQSLTASPLMAMSPKDCARHEDRLRDYHADLPLVNTPTIQKVISTGRLLIQLNRRQISARRGMVISGMSGTGKTTALTQLGRAHELAIRRRFPDDGDRLPVIYVTVPPAATPRIWPSSSPASSAWNSRLAPTSPTSPTLSARSPRTLASIWSWSTRSTTSPWPPGRARKCRIN